MKRILLFLIICASLAFSQRLTSIDSTFVDSLTVSQLQNTVLPTDNVNDNTTRMSLPQVQELVTKRCGEIQKGFIGDGVRYKLTKKQKDLLDGKTN